MGVGTIPNPLGEGLWVDQLVKDGPAKRAGVLREDVIKRLDGETVGNPAKLMTLLNRHESGDEVTLTIKREGEEKPLEIAVTLGTPPPPKGQQKRLAFP